MVSAHEDVPVTEHPEDQPHAHAHSHPHAHPHADVSGDADPPSLPATAPTAHQPTSVATPLLYIDCFSGIAGDMLLGALLDAGLPRASLEAGLARLDLGGYRLEVGAKQSYGITGTKLDVLVNEAVQPERRLDDILALLGRSQLPAWVRANAEAIFRRLAVAEAKIHGTSIDAVHFHEVGAVDSIVDIVGNLIGLHALGIQQVYASSLPLPGGTIRAQHGLLPAPAPATLEILAQVGAPTRPAPVLGELVTPTGAAILAELATFEQPLIRVHRVGYGYGTKELAWPNAVRVWLGEAWSPAPPRLPHPTHRSTSVPGPVVSQLGPPPREQTPRATIEALAPAGDAAPAIPSADEIVVIEANLDDMTPEMLGYAMERLLEAGALDVYFSAIQMKKNRPGTLLGVMARPGQARELAQLILRETSTLGVRLRRSERIVTERRSETVATPFGPVRVKLKLLPDRTVAAPEYEDCALIARTHGVPLADVYRAVQAAAETLCS
ncbi:MAG: nickel pincer cofactor biosynthesis protein LarC [Chloroflexota bacterium]